MRYKFHTGGATQSVRRMMPLAAALALPGAAAGTVLAQGPGAVAREQGEGREAREEPATGGPWECALPFPVAPAWAPWDLMPGFIPAPPVRVCEDARRIAIEVALPPGLVVTGVTTAVRDGALTVRGTCRPEGVGGGRGAGRFEWTVAVPEGVDRQAVRVTRAGRSVHIVVTKPSA